jgi:hypothetical protein
VALGFACGVPLLGGALLALRLWWLQRAFEREMRKRSPIANMPGWRGYVDERGVYKLERMDDSAGDGVQ